MHVAHGSTKAAVAHMAELLGAEWATSGVRVNSVAPGYTETPIVDALTEQGPDVSSRSGSHPTTLHVDCGYSARWPGMSECCGTMRP